MPVLIFISLYLLGNVMQKNLRELSEIVFFYRSTLHLVHLSEDIRKNRAAIRFQTFNTLKSLFVAKIICHQEFFVHKAEITKTNPMDKLRKLSFHLYIKYFPIKHNTLLVHSFFGADLFDNKIAATNLRKLMLKSAWKISPEIKTGLKQESNSKKHRARRDRKLFVNLLIYQGVVELDGPNLGSWRTETDFWKTMVKEGAASLLRVSFDQTPKLLGRYLCYLLALEKL
jgi:hypothetical protein